MESAEGEEKVKWRRWQCFHGMLRNREGFSWVLRRVQNKRSLKKKSHTSGLMIDSCPSSIIQYNFLTIIVAYTTWQGLQSLSKTPPDGRKLRANKVKV